MDMEEKLLRAYKDSIKYLESMSALELMKRASLLAKDLEKLSNSQGMPPTIITGCLVNEIFRLNSEPDMILLDDKITKMFTSFKKYMDDKFMKKE